MHNAHNTEASIYKRGETNEDTQDNHCAFIFLTTIITADNGAHKHHRRYFRHVSVYITVATLILRV